MYIQEPTMTITSIRGLTLHSYPTHLECSLGPTHLKIFIYPFVWDSSGRANFLSHICIDPVGNPFEHISTPTLPNYLSDLKIRQVQATGQISCAIEQCLNLDIKVTRSLDQAPKFSITILINNFSLIVNCNSPLLHPTTFQSHPVIDIRAPQSI